MLSFEWRELSQPSFSGLFPCNATAFASQYVVYFTGKKQSSDCVKKGVSCSNRADSMDVSARRLSPERLFRKLLNPSNSLRNRKRF